MPVPPVVPAELRSRVFRGTAVVGEGLLTRAQLRSSAWRRVLPDVYVHGDVALTHALRARAAAGVLLPDAVVTGSSAAVLWGVDLLGPEDDVELTRPPGTSPVRVPGLRVRRAVLPADAVCRRRGVAVTTPEATAVAVAAALPGDDGVVAVDRLVRSGVVDLDAVRRCALVRTGARSRRARAVCALADGLAESPQETRVRLLLGRSRLPAPVAQFRVYDGPRFVARVDFGWPAQRLALEYDGLWHAAPGQFAEDRRRLNRLLAAGWRVVFVTAADLHQPERLVAGVAAALGI